MTMNQCNILNWSRNSKREGIDLISAMEAHKIESEVPCWFLAINNFWTGCIYFDEETIYPPCLTLLYKPLIL